MSELLIGTEVVERHWPYDGPHTPENVIAAASAIERLVRYLNNATGHREVLAVAPDLAAVLTDVGSAVGGLDQLLRQFASAAERLADDPTLYDDQNDDEMNNNAGGVARDLAVEIGTALESLAGLDEDMRRAVSLANRLGHYTAERRLRQNPR